MPNCNMDWVLQDIEGENVKFGAEPQPEKDVEGKVTKAAPLDTRPDLTVRKACLTALNRTIDPTVKVDPQMGPPALSLIDEETKAELIIKLRNNWIEFTIDEIEMMKKYVLIYPGFEKAQCLRILKGVADPLALGPTLSQPEDAEQE